MRNARIVVMIFFDWYYRAARRKLARYSLIYRFYRACTPLRNLDRMILHRLDTIGIVDLSAELTDVKILIDQKRYRDSLYKAAAILESAKITQSHVLLELLQLCIAFKAWEWYAQVLYPMFKKVAREARRHLWFIRKDRQAVLEEAAMLLIQNARLKESIQLFQLLDSIEHKERYKLLIALLEFTLQERPRVDDRGHGLRALAGEGEINLVGSIVWGEKYLDAFMRYNVRSMLAPGNMPHLREKGVLIHSIVTTEAGMEYVKNHPVYPLLSEVAQVEFFCFPETLLDLFKGADGPDKWSYMLYGILDHLNLFFARSLRANLFLIPVDSIVANPSFTHMRRYLEEGYDCCGGGNLVAEKETFLPALDEHYGKDKVLAIDTRSLATLALKHPHHYITSQLICDANTNFGKHARELFWPVEGGIAVHSIYTHPLATAARRIGMDYDMPYSWVDFLLPPRLFDKREDFPKYKIIDNAQEAYINNFAPGARKYETTGRAFDPDDFTCVHTCSYPIHRHMLKTRQFIPCDMPATPCRNHIDEDMVRVRESLEQYFGSDERDRVKETLYPMDWDGCHLCGSMRMDEVIDLGMLPISHQLRRSLDQEEKRYPVRFHFCNQCGLLQMRDPIEPDALYDAETYATGFQKPKHIEDLIVTALSHRAPGPVLDVGCNDGSLLRVLDSYKFPQLVGIEPNRHAASIASQNPAHVIYTDYLSSETAMMLAQKHASFDFIFIRHVLEHVTQVKQFFGSINQLLSEDGLLVLELPYVEAGFEANNPVILWEEHVNYFTEPGIRAMLNHFGFEVVDKRYYAFGGGAIAFIAKRKTPVALDFKASKGFPIRYYQRFAIAIGELKRELNEVIDFAHDQGYEVLLYGAAPRSCTLVNYAQLDAKIDHVIDDRTDIQRLYMPGTQKQVTALEDALIKAPVLALLGVGGEHEHTVMAKLEKKLGYRPASVSLFPPRDIRATLRAAHASIRGEEDAAEPYALKTA